MRLMIQTDAMQNQLFKNKLLNNLGKCRRYSCFNAMDIYTKLNTRPRLKFRFFSSIKFYLFKTINCTEYDMKMAVGNNCMNHR